MLNRSAIVDSSLLHCVNFHTLATTVFPPCTVNTSCIFACPYTVGLHGSSLPSRYTLYLLLPPRLVSAIVSSSLVPSPFLDAYPDACDRTDCLTLRISGRRMAIDAAMMPVPGSAVAQIVALIDVVLRPPWLKSRPFR